MLEFILGRACTGKTYETINRVSAASKSGRAVLIVPEQFSFESERAIIRNNEAKVDNISVLSFSRLYDEVVENTGRGAIACVSEFEKIILIRKSIKACIDNLEVFSKYASYRDFSRRIADTIRDFKFAGVSAEELSDAAVEIGGTCGAKLKDISIIMLSYDALLQNKFIDPADRLTRLCQVLNDFEYFKGTTVFFDSFTGFTGQQYKIIEKILEQADRVVFSFCTDRPDNTSLGVFYNINSAIKKINSIARSRGLSDGEVKILDRHFYSNAAMQSLEKLMATGSSCNAQSSDGNIRIISCDNRREEALAAANIIAKEVSENGYRFKDFILVARSAEDYANYVSRQCELNNVACFMDKSMSLAKTPLCIYIMTLFEAVRSSTTDNILRLLKLGLTDICAEDISELEDYTFVWDIKAADWQNEWKMSVKGLQTDEDSEHDIARLKKINDTRLKAYALVSHFKASFVGTPVSRAKAVFCHLTDNHIDRNISRLCDEFECEGNNYYASVLKQSWDCVIGILDSLVRTLDDREINTDEFVDSFVIAAESSDITNIPQMLDEVTFGSADRIRPSKPKISIIMGANQGVFPAITSNTGLLASADKDKLTRCGIILDDDIIRGAVEENYLVYSMLCCPVDKVYVLYSKKSMKGEELEPSTFVSKLLDGFPDLKTTEFKLSSTGEYTPRTAKSAFGEMGSMPPKDFYEIKSSLSDRPEYAQKLLILNKTPVDSDFTISQDTSKALFGKELHISATKFDTYHKCSLSFLLKNGLRVKKLQKADLNVLQRGTIAHFVLETIIARHHGKLSELSDLQISAEVDSIIHDYMSAVKGSEMLMTARFAYLLEKISASVKEIVYHISQEFAQSEFEPKYCELTIGSDGDIPRMEYTLSDGSKAFFDGKIDRVDVYKNNVRVVDYKTGRMTFALSDTLVGLNMQMLLYLYAFTKNGGELVESPRPAGILYMPAKSSKDKKSFRMNGLISSDEEIRTAMEKDNGGVYIPKFTEKSGEYIDGELFSHIFSKIDELMRSMGDSVRRGDFSANPTDGINIKACAYCDFASICRSSDKEHKTALQHSNQEIAEILKGGDSSGV